MECLLIGGAQSVGKSEAIYRLTNRLLLNGFAIIAGSVPTSFIDFRVVIEGKNNRGHNIRIIINSPTDTVDIIKEFKVFLDQNGSFDILISSIRDDNFWPRNDFFSIIDISNTKNYILEIPLAKITKRNGNFTTALNWYQTKIDNLLMHSLGNAPFEI